LLQEPAVLSTLAANAGLSFDRIFRALWHPGMLPEVLSKSSGWMIAPSRSVGVIDVNPSEVLARRKIDKGQGRIRLEDEHVLWYSVHDLLDVASADGDSRIRGDQILENMEIHGRSRG
jgi:hypothetical protein